MNNSKHTPGPWITERCDAGMEILDVEQESVAVACHFGDPYSSIREEANARLIAAAPTMYEALQAVVAELATFGHINSQDNDPDGTESPSIAKVFAAIKAATI